MLQLLHEEEEPSVRYVQIIEQIFKEFLVEVEADVVKVNTEVSCQGLAHVRGVALQMFVVLCRCLQ